MESWKKGRKEIFEELAKLCDGIEHNVVAELDEENTVRISREELKLLRENSARATELAGHNGQLVDELEECREALSRLEVLEKENKRLATELRENIRQQESKPIERTSKNADPVQSKTTPRSSPRASVPPSSATEVEFDESKLVDRNYCRAMVEKLNKTIVSFRAMKELKETFEGALREEKEKLRKWALYGDSQSKNAVKRDQKIKALEAQVQELEEEVKKLVQPPDVADDEEGPEAPLLDGEILQLPVLQGVVEVLADPVKSSRPNGGPSFRKTTDLTIDRASKVLDDLGIAEPEINEPDEEMELPALTEEEVRAVQDTNYEPLEQHHSSSTQDLYSELKSPPRSPHKEITSHDDTPANVPSSPDSPIFVGAKSVKKRKRQTESTEAGPLIKVKNEHLPSSPIGITAFRNLNANESMDLDDIGEKVDTPRKQRRLRELALQASLHHSQSSHSLGSEVQSQDEESPTEASASRSEVQDTPIQHRHSFALQPKSANQQILPRTSDGKESKRRRIPSNEQVAALVEDNDINSGPTTDIDTLSPDVRGRLEDLLAMPSPAKRVLSPAKYGGQPTLALQSGIKVTGSSSLADQAVTPIIFRSNVSRVHAQSSRGTSRTTREEASENPRPFSRKITEQVQRSLDRPRASNPSISAKLVEPDRPRSRDSSGSSAESERAPPNKRQAISTPRVFKPGRSTCDDESMSRKRIATPKMLPPSPGSYSRASTDDTTPKARQSNLTSRLTGSNKRHSRAEMTELDWEMDPDQEPLRSRPVETLSISDFKINPNYNQGLGYAFSEVVRGSNARACLQGCTKPECCGNKFRALAEVTRNPGKPRTEDEEEADSELLEEFMGDNAHKIQSLNKDEREELILQAMTRQLANRHGRHRHAYERRASPEGFWRADFPTTQEQMEDRAKSKEKGKDLVLQRHREAMRPGGAYMFRDE